MRKLSAALLIYLGLASAALAQQITPPVGAQGVACAYNTTIPSVTAGFFGYVQCDSAGRLISIPNSLAPANATIVANSASAVATLAAAVGKMTYICGFSVDSNATAAASGTASITNTSGGTMNFVQGVAALPAVATLSRTFYPCIPASANNTAISVGAATGAGGGATTVNAWGYQQ